MNKNFSFEPPPDWIESSVVRFHPPPSPPGAPPVPSITVEQEPLTPGSTLQLHAHRYVVRLSRTAPGFELLNTEDMTIGGRPAMLLRFRFLPSPEAQWTMEQTTALVAVDKATVAIVSIASPSESAQSNMPFFANVLRSMRFGEPISTPPPSPRASRPPLEMPYTPMPGAHRR
jgi:hypothetical protein